MARFFRWVPRKYASNAIDFGLTSHNGSAMWIFGMGQGQTYRPGQAIYKGAYLIAYTLDEVATNNITTSYLINFESAEFEGEAAHPSHVIIKSNEPGALGIGKMRQRNTNTKTHVKTSYATKSEVAKALEKSELEVSVEFKPPTGWA
ncbi:hypothetical protein ACDJ03_00735 [Xanthomonas axonopodis pv. nakataecorchori]|uniref:hypothetical protein n=1 Tax=Xanthomonas TaxID=338 RepID=UPI001C455CEB|nr:hypothetical protein [Xanthomonas euvesicatoria]MBV6868202.1 hypothetical protein [Xanthomonas campestris pv. coriandri]MCE4331127.1 hypothetical protein [Xanthomonas campestris pv. coriandri]